MKKAIFLFGPSGSGKTTLTKQILRKYDFKHCDTDYFKLIFSPQRSEERSSIAVEVCYTYAKELIKRGHNIITEALSSQKISNLKRLLKNANYEVIEVTLVTSLEQCLKNNKTRKERCFSDEVIKESF